MEAFTSVVCTLLWLFQIVMLARIILSWILSANVQVPGGLRPIVEIIYTVTDPPMRLVRPLVPPLRVGAMALDLSPLLIFFLIILLQGAFCR